MSTAVAPPTRDWFALPARARLGWVVLLGSMTALHALTLDLYLPALPQLRTDLGTSAHLVQLTLTANLVGLAVGELVAGPLSDALGRRAPLVAGLALHLAASLGCALAPSIEVLGALRVLQGLGAAASAVTALAVAGDLFDGAGASRLIGRLLLVVGVSPVLAPTLGAQLLRVVDWRGVFAVLAAAAALLAVVVALRLPETLPAARRRPAGARGTASTYRTLLGDRATWGLVVVVGLTFSVIFSFVAGAPLVLQSLHGLDPESFSLAFAAVAASLVVGTQVPAQLATRVSPQRLMLLGLVGALVASAALALALALAVAAGAVGVGGRLGRGPGGGRAVRDRGLRAAAGRHRRPAQRPDHGAGDDRRLRARPGGARRCRPTRAASRALHRARRPPTSERAPVHGARRQDRRRPDRDRPRPHEDHRSHDHPDRTTTRGDRP